LPERPGFLHAMPVLDLFALLWLLFLLAPSLVLQSGVGVELPPSRFQLDRYEDTVVLTLKGTADGPIIHLGREQLDRGELEKRLDALRAAGADRKAMVLLQSDQSTPVGVEREISEIVLGKGFRMALVGRSEWKRETPPEDN
jgi:biopolymer transport protein ExbD